MAYFPPYIDATGYHMPTYDDIYQYQLELYQQTWGQIVSTDNSDFDIQDVANTALLQFDAYNTFQLVYNSFSVGTAVGAAQDALYQVNNIARKSPGYSSAVLTLVGAPLTIINNGVAQDQNGYLWDIPQGTNLGNSGTINVTAICETLGAVSAQPNTINIVSVGPGGWMSVNNAAKAATGQPVEGDSQFRARQAVSTSIRSKTLVAGTLAAIAETPNVTRYNPGTPSPDGTSSSVENPTGADDYFGNPPHSISMVVEGGLDLDVATAIFNNKTPGTDLNGTTVVLVTDPNTGNSMNISFFRPTYVPIYVTLTVHGLTGYSSAVTTLIQTAIVNYLNALQIGESLTISGLYAAAMAVMPNILLPQFSIQSIKAGTSATPTGTTDIAVNFNQVVEGVTGNVVVTID